jgi:hypothetical protein
MDAYSSIDFNRSRDVAEGGGGKMSTGRQIRPSSPGSWKMIPQRTAICGAGLEEESAAAACAAATEERNAAARAQQSAADMSTGGEGGASTLAYHINFPNCKCKYAVYSFFLVSYVHNNV